VIHRASGKEDREPVICRIDTPSRSSITGTGGISALSCCGQSSSSQRRFWSRAGCRLVRRGDNFTKPRDKYSISGRNKCLRNSSTASITRFRGERWGRPHRRMRSMGLAASASRRIARPPDFIEARTLHREQGANTSSPAIGRLKIPVRAFREQSQLPGCLPSRSIKDTT